MRQNMTNAQNIDTSEPPDRPDSPEVYQGQFGEFTVTAVDRRSVVIYRTGLMIVACSFALGAGLVLSQDKSPIVWVIFTLLYSCFSIGLGVSLLTIHIYLAPLHRALQAFWLIGSVAAIVFAHGYSEPFALAVYHHPNAIWGIGFTFAALTGIFFKEAFCFNRLEAKLLTLIVPMLLLGHLFGILPLFWEQAFLVIWSIAFLIFALRKAFQPIPPDIGDKSVFAYLAQQRTAKA